MFRVSNSPLVSASGLALELQSGAGPVVLDVRWTLAGSERNAFLDSHLPGAVFVDLDRELAAPPGLGGRHPLPSAQDLQEVWRGAGIDDDSSVVVYDGGSGLAASRAWWMLRWSGFSDVRVLDGGLPAWLAASDRPVESAEVSVQRGSMTVRPGGMPVVDADEAAELATGMTGVLVDARAAARYRGEIEPLDPVAGHIPGAVNLPIADLLNNDNTFCDRADLRAKFAAAGIVGDGGTVAASCGSGVTACQLILAGEIAGLDLALYPGSYSQWCALGRPVATGIA
jgi:thiosulfate/3-mercaptopyruvate sulfurtransferase